MLDTQSLRDILKANKLKVRGLNEMVPFAEDTVLRVLNDFGDHPLRHRDPMDAAMFDHIITTTDKPIELEQVVINIVDALTNELKGKSYERYENRT